MNAASRIVAVSGLAVALAASLPAQVVQLKSGDTLVGEIQNPDDQGLTIRRFDNGGTLQLRWDQLAPASQHKIKEMFLLSVDEESEVLVSADVIRYRLDSGGADEVVGRIVAEDPMRIFVQVKDTRYPIKRANITRHESRQVPALDIFTAERFYSDQLAEHQPGDDADKHILLADVLMRVRDYDNAKVHLDKAAELGGGKQPAMLDGKRKRLELYRQAKAEADLLDSIRQAMHRGRFGVGLERIAAYEAQYTKGKLRNEFARLKDRFEQARERFLVRRIVELWRRSEVNFARKKATEYGAGYESVRAYAEEQMGKDIREHVAKVLELEVDEVEELWSKRVEELRTGLAANRYSYGVGSWVLGESAILKDTPQGEAESKAKEGQSERDRIEEQRMRRIQRVIDRARRAAAKRGRSGKGEYTPEDWWKDAGTDERRVWLRAYYAEFGGDLERTAAHLSNCLTCGARGFLEVAGDTGKLKKEKCPTCHGTRFKRWIRAR